MPTYNETPGDKEVVEVYYEARWRELDRGMYNKKFDSDDHNDPEVQLAAALAFATTKALELSQGFNVTDIDTRVEVIEIEVHERRMRIFTKDEVMALLKPKVEGFSESEPKPYPQDGDTDFFKPLISEPGIAPEVKEPEYQPKPVDLDDEIPF